MQPKPDTTALLLSYIAAASEASKRSRRVLVVLIVATTVAFFANWNSRANGWLRSRLAVEEDVLRWWAPLRSGAPLFFGDPEMKFRFDQARRYYSDRINAGDAVDSTRIAQ